MAAALALLFLGGGISDALGARPCPHHEGLPAPASAGHETHPDPAAPDHPDAPGESHGACTCAGSCHAGTAPSFAVPAAAGAVPVADPPALSSPAPPAPTRSALAPFSLPWGNAPPAL